MTLTSTLTKLGLLNEVLVSIGERETRATASNLLSKLGIQTIQDAIYAVCNGNTWSELRRITNALSWANDVATLPSNFTRIRNVYWYTSPDGDAETAYDYSKFIIPYVDIEEYEQQVLVPFDDNAGIPRVWSVKSRNELLVNPYPDNALAKSKCFFEYYLLLDLPSSDGSTFACSDLLLNLIKWKACELLSAKHLGDFEQAQFFMISYENLLKQHRKSDSGQGVKGYNMHRRNHRRTIW